MRGEGEETSTCDREITGLGRRKKYISNFLQVHTLVARERIAIEEHPLIILPTSVTGVRHHFSKVSSQTKGR